MKSYLCLPRLILIRNWITAVLLAVSCFPADSFSQSSVVVSDFPDIQKLRLAFWNLENYMDTVNDEGRDGEFTPDGSMKWNTTRLDSKTNHLARVIHDMNPDILGVAEVEHKSLLNTLIAHDALNKVPFGVVHFESPDLRGIDVAMLYNKNKMLLVQAISLKVNLPENGTTRDILVAELAIKDKMDTLYVFVNHWPSRREGTQKTAAKRLCAANTLRKFLDSVKLREKQVVVMGDFNDNPEDQSIQQILVIDDGAARRFELPGWSGGSAVTGTCNYGSVWNYFDQIMLSQAFMKPAGAAHLKYHNGSFTVFKPEYLCEYKDGTVKAPFRTFIGKEWINGYSDHFPVMAELRYE